MVTIETFTAGGETLTGTFTFTPTAVRAILSTIEPGRGVVVTVNRREIELTYPAFNSIVDGDKVEVFF
jgi:hypothetical protein